MRAVLFFVVLLLLPVVSAEYLVVTMDVGDRSVEVRDIELAFTASMRPHDQDGWPVLIEVVDDGWRSVSRARITASAVEVLDGPDGSRSLVSDRTRVSAIVPVDRRAQLLIVRTAGGGEIFDLRSASCGAQPLCSNCARIYPHWCDRARSSDSTFNPVLVLIVVLNVLVLSVIIVLLMARRRESY